MTDVNGKVLPQGQSAQIVPFGKYKGQPVELMAEDRSYCEWATAQDWFPVRYPTIYQTVINYGGPSQDSPEHNAMQARFLNADYRLAVARTVCPNLDKDIYWIDDWAKKNMRQKFSAYIIEERFPSKAWSAEFEVDGWDVVYNIDPAHEYATVESLPPCTCDGCNHDKCYELRTRDRGLASESALNWCPAGYRYCDHRGHTPRFLPSDTDGRSGQHCDKGCVWSDPRTFEWFRAGGSQFGVGVSPKLFIECKPSLGDDFPTVLRQVKSYKATTGHRIVLVDQITLGGAVSWDQVKEMFAASDIDLIRDSDLRR